MTSAKRWIEPLDFQDLHKLSGLSRAEVAKALDVTARTVQNWETGGARIPWMAYRMLRILRGYALPGHAWEGWTLRGDTLYSPDNRGFPAGELYFLRNVFAQAKLFRQLYTRAGCAKTAAPVVASPLHDRAGRADAAAIAFPLHDRDADTLRTLRTHAAPLASNTQPLPGGEPDTGRAGRADAAIIAFPLRERDADTLRTLQTHAAPPCKQRPPPTRG